MREWSTWSGSFRNWIDEELVPTTLQELVDSVRGLSSQRGDRVHAQGSKWAFSAPAYCENLVVDTTKLRGFPQFLQDAVNEPRAGGKLRVAVEAGIKVRDLNFALYGRPERRFEGGPTPRVIADAGELDTWVLPVLGGAGGQSIAGVINTGTHGGDAARPPLSDAVMAMLVVGSGGVLRLIQRRANQSPPVVDRTRLAEGLRPLVANADVQDLQDDALLNAAVLSVGRFGVVYAYVLEVVNENGWLLLEKRTRESWDDVRSTLSASITDAFAQDRFLQIVLNPNRRPDGKHTAYVTTHTKLRTADIPGEARWVIDARAPRGAMLMFQQLCGTAITPELEAVRTGLIAAGIALPLAAPAVIAAAAVAGGLLPPPFGLIAPLLATTAGLAIPALVALLFSTAEKLGQIGPDYIIGDAIADILNEATDLGFPAMADVLTGALLDSQQSQTLPTEITGGIELPWIVFGTRFEIADFFDYDNPDCYRGNSIEVFFDATNGRRLGDTIDRMLDLFDALRSGGAAFGGYVSLRFMARSAALLGLSRWATTCSAEVAAIRGLRGNERAFNMVRDFTLANGGVVHWGQINTVNSGAIVRSFGADLNLFHRKLFETEGNSLLFRTPFSYDHHLEVPRALIGGGSPWTGWEPLGLVTQTSPGVANAGFGQPLEVFAVDDGSVIVSRERRIDGSADPPWTPVVSAPAAGRPVLVRGRSGRLELFVSNALHVPPVLQHTYEAGRPGGAWAPWDTLGFLSTLEIASDPSVAAHTDGRLEVFALAGRQRGEQRMAHCWANFEASYWSNVWLRGLGSIGTPPSACHRNLDSDQIAVISAFGGSVMVIQQNGPAGDSGWTEWSPLTPVAGPALTVGGIGGPIIVNVTGEGAGARIFAMNTRGEVFTTRDLLAGLPLSWSPWEMLPTTASFGFLAPACRLAAVMTDRLYLFGRSQHGEVLVCESLPGGIWTGWRNLGGEIAGDIAAGVHADGRVEIVARSLDGGALLARRQSSPGTW